MATPILQTLLILSAIFSLLASVAAGTNVLYSGERLSTGERLVYKQYTLLMQTDCNLVVYAAGGNPIWASGSYGLGRSCYLSLEPTGELIIYSPRHGLPSPVWRSHATSVQGSYALVLQYDGGLRVYGPKMWVSNSSTGSAGKLAGTGESWPVTTDSVLFTGDVAPIGTTIVNGGHALVLEETCNLVLYNNGAKVWETNTTDKLGDCFVNLEATGEFKLKYLGGATLWTNGVKSDYGEHVLVLRPDGKLVVYGPAIWSGKKSVSVELGVGSDVDAVVKIAMVTAE